MIENKKTLIFIAPVESRSGYGDCARDILRSLIALDKFNISIAPLIWGATPLNGLDPIQDKYIYDLFIQDLNMEKRPDISIQMTIPPEFKKIADINIGMTAGIETTTCSIEWLYGLNIMDLIIVPSEHSKNVFINSIYTHKETGQNIKCNTPIEVLFEGIDINIFKKIDSLKTGIRRSLNEISETFAFLFVGHWLNGDVGHDRKDVGMLIKTFLSTFKNIKNPPVLILKTSATSSIIELEQIQHKINMIKQSIDGNLPNVYLLTGNLTQEEMNELYNHPKVKVHVSFTKGEGFGRPLLEASMSEKPIIASNWSGHLDFLNKSNSILLPGELKNIHPSAVWDKVIIPESKWFYVNYSYASSVLKSVFTQYNNYLLGAKNLYNINKQKFTFDNMTIKLNEILDKYIAQPIFLNNITIPKK